MYYCLEHSFLFGLGLDWGWFSGLTPDLYSGIIPDEVLGTISGAGNHIQVYNCADPVSRQSQLHLGSMELRMFSPPNSWRRKDGRPADDQRQFILLQQCLYKMKRGTGISEAVHPHLWSGDSGTVSQRASNISGLIGCALRMDYISLQEAGSQNQ